MFDEGNIKNNKTGQKPRAQTEYLVKTPVFM